MHAYVFLCVCMYVCVYVCIYVYRIYLFIYVCLYVYTHTHTHTYIHAYIHKSIHTNDTIPHTHTQTNKQTGLEKPSVLPGPGLKQKKFAWTWPNGAPPPPHEKSKRGIVTRGSLRLPLGIAASLMLARFEALQDEVPGRTRREDETDDMQVVMYVCMCVCVCVYACIYL